MELSCVIVIVQLIFLQFHVCARNFCHCWLYLILSAVGISVRNILHLYPRYEQIFS